MTSSKRLSIPPISTAILFAWLAFAGAVQVGCQQAHEPPKLDSAAMDAKLEEQMKLREMERSGGSAAK